MIEKQGWMARKQLSNKNIQEPERMKCRGKRRANFEANERSNPIGREKACTFYDGLKTPRKQET